MKKSAIVSFILLSSSILLLVILGIFQKELLDSIKDIVGNYIWPSLIAVLTFFGFVVGGVVKDQPKSFTEFLGNILVLIASVELFLFIAVLTYFAYINSQLGEIELQLSSGNTGKHIKAIQIFKDDTTNIQLPCILPDLTPGDYKFKITEAGFFADSQIVSLNAGAKKKAVLKDNVERKIRINSQPSGAEIWVDNSRESITPGTLTIQGNDDRKLILKYPGYQDTLLKITLLDKPSIIDLGEIKLLKLYKVKIVCANRYYEFEVNGRRYKGSQDEVLMHEGSYSIPCWLGIQKFSKPVNISKNDTIFIQ